MIKNQILTLALALVLVKLSSCLQIAQAQLSPSQLIVSERQKPPVRGRPPDDERKPAGTHGEFIMYCQSRLST